MSLGKAAILGVLFWWVGAWVDPGQLRAGHPLITDDTGVQGKAGFQIEFNGILGYDREQDTVERSTEMATVLSYGVSSNADLVLGIPYQHVRTRDEGESFKRDGISDLSLEVKWRFYEVDGLSFAAKPGITLPTGNRKEGLGTGRPTFGLTWIATQAVEPWAFHLNLGYRRNENKLLERKDIWHLSLASELQLLKALRLVANIGIERNTERKTDNHPAFIIGGVIYSFNDSLEINFGVQFGLSKTEVDYAIRPGVVFRFNL